MTKEYTIPMKLAQQIRMIQSNLTDDSDPEISMDFIFPVEDSYYTLHIEKYSWSFTVSNVSEEATLFLSDVNAENAKLVEKPFYVADEQEFFDTLVASFIKEYND